MLARLQTRLRGFVCGDRGAYQAEFAITFPVLMLLSLGLLEFSLLGFDFQRAAEASRRAVRFAVIGNPIANTANLLEGDTIVCTSTGGTVSCIGGSPADDPEYDPGTGDANFQAMLAEMTAIYPGIAEENVRITYESTNVGDPGDAGGIIPLVTIEVINLQHNFATGHVIGVESMTFPDFKTSVLGSGRTVNAS